MEKFTRARSDENKQIRYREIMEAADRLYREIPYSEITLTAIASSLSWTRANLYKYFSTKEEIFLSIIEEKLKSYHSSLLEAIPEEAEYSKEALCEIWANIISSHREYFQYSSILSIVIETNVSIDRLVSFKKSYYESAERICLTLSSLLKTSKEAADRLQMAVYYQAIGLYGTPPANEKMREALRRIGREYRMDGLTDRMKEFISIYLNALSEEG